MAIFQDNRFKRTGWVKSNRYLPFPEKEWKNIKFHKGSFRIACSKWRVHCCEHAIIQQVPLRVQFVLSSGVISRVQFVISRKIADTKTLGIDSKHRVHTYRELSSKKTNIKLRKVFF